MLSVAIGLAAAFLLPGTHQAVTRGLFGWNVSVWLYLGLAGLMMLQADHAKLRRIALAQAYLRAPTNSITICPNSTTQQ